MLYLKVSLPIPACKFAHRNLISFCFTVGGCSDLEYMSSGRKCIPAGLELIQVDVAEF